MKGSYILLIRVKKNSRIKVGKLGVLHFPAGIYCYVGSAMGRGNPLLKRIERHLRKKKKIRWHVDYLLVKPSVTVEAVFLFPSQKRLECLISRKMEKYAEFSVNGFGCSDCKCKSHLHYFKDLKKALEVMKILSRKF